MCGVAGCVGASMGEESSLSVPHPEAALHPCQPAYLPPPCALPCWLPLLPVSLPWPAAGAASEAAHAWQ